MKRYLICFLLSSFILPVMPQEDNVDRVVKKGMKLREMGFFKNAVECYQKGLRVCPESTLIYFEMAYSYACMNEMEKSMECAEKAMLFDEDSHELLDLWIYLIWASENMKNETRNMEELEFEHSPREGGQIDQIH